MATSDCLRWSPATSRGRNQSFSAWRQPDHCSFVPPAGLPARNVSFTACEQGSCCTRFKPLHSAGLPGSGAVVEGAASVGGGRGGGCTSGDARRDRELFGGGSAAGVVRTIGSGRSNHSKRARRWDHRRAMGRCPSADRRSPAPAALSGSGAMVLTSGKTIMLGRAGRSGSSPTTNCGRRPPDADGAAPGRSSSRIRDGRVASASGNGGAGSRSLLSGQGRFGYDAVSGGSGERRNVTSDSASSMPGTPAGKLNPDRSPRG